MIERGLYIVKNNNKRVFIFSHDTKIIGSQKELSDVKFEKQTKERTFT